MAACIASSWTARAAGSSMRRARAAAIGPGRQARPRNSGTARVSETRFTSVTVSVRSIRPITTRVNGAKS